jgi:hypothetical protein
MSDFLLRLAHQALGSEPGLQPVPRPRYSPAPAALEPDEPRYEAPGAAAEHRVGRSRRAPPDQPPPSAPRAPADRREDRPSAPLATEPAEPPPSAPLRQARTPGPVPQRSAAGTSPAVQRTPTTAPRDEGRPGAVPASRSPDAPLLPAHAEAARARLPSVQPPERPAPREAVERAGSGRTTPTAVAGATAAEGRGSGPGERAALRGPGAAGQVPRPRGVEEREAGGTSDGPFVPAADAATLLPPVHPAPPSARGGDHRAGGDRPPPPAAEPPVRVTIGRIEVRAVTPERPAEPAPAPAWQPPVLSLDEYLRGTGRA